MKDILCTKSNWASRGRICLTMADCLDGEGHERSVTIEGIPIQEQATKAMVHTSQVQNLPTDISAVGIIM